VIFFRYTTVTIYHLRYAYNKVIIQYNLMENTVNKSYSTADKLNEAMKKLEKLAVEQKGYAYTAGLFFSTLQIATWDMSDRQKERLIRDCERFITNHLTEK